MTDGIPNLGIEPRESMVVEIARKLLDYLLISSDLAPGDRIPSERQLAQAFGVGRSSIREALKSLSVLGVIDVRQGDGTFLRQPDSEILPKVIAWGLLLGEQRVTDLVEARQFVEVATSRLAAHRRNASELAELHRTVDIMATTTDADVFVDADIEFHLAVARAASNTVLEDVLTSIQSLLRVWITRVMSAEEEFHISASEHVAVLEAIDARDSEAAAEAMLIHMQKASARLAATLDVDGLI